MGGVYFFQGFLPDDFLCPACFNQSQQSKTTAPPPGPSERHRAVPQGPWLQPIEGVSRTTRCPNVQLHIAIPHSYHFFLLALFLHGSVFTHSKCSTSGLLSLSMSKLTGGVREGWMVAVNVSIMMQNVLHLAGKWTWRVTMLDNATGSQAHPLLPATPHCAE